MTTKVVGAGAQKVIALHGWFGDADGWGEFPEMLDQEKYSVAFVDYRGYGARVDEAGDHSLAEISADVLAVADELGWQQFALLGHSMGGAAILKVYADAPQRVQALIGVSPVCCFPTPFDDQTRDLFEGAAQNDANRYGIIDFTTGNRNSATWVNTMVAYSVEHSDRTAFGDYLQSWANADFQVDPSAGNPVVHLVVGSGDPALGRATMEQTWLKLWPEATLTELTDAGHYAMYETPVRFLTEVETALGKI